MQTVNQTHQKQSRPVQILQFGEGNFLRGFVDCMVDIANERGVMDAGVAIVKPIPQGSLDTLKAQNCIYTVLLRGKQDGAVSEQSRVITCVDRALDCYGEYDSYLALAGLDSLRIVVSNTTEAGIVYDACDRLDDRPPSSFPGKLAQFLYARFNAFNGDSSKGLILLPVELIDDNGGKLKDCVLKFAEQWALPQAFTDWIENACVFCNTLVDRIITGYPHNESEELFRRLGYRDDMLVTGEPFALWVIESDKIGHVRRLFPLDDAGLPVLFTDNQRPYRERKVRVLNGAHTGAVAAAFLAGLDTVADCMNDADLRQYILGMIHDEIVPCVPLPDNSATDSATAFARAVTERFENPFIRHRLLSIALNSISKWRTRILPSLTDYFQKYNALPPRLTFSFAALLMFYHCVPNQEGKVYGMRNGEPYEIIDDAAALDFLAAHCNAASNDYVCAAAANTSLWGCDLSRIPGFCELASRYLDDIRQNGMRSALLRL